MAEGELQADQRAKCRVCSEEVRIGGDLCSSGCGFVDLIPRDAGGPLPASWSLGLVMGLYFLLFNQLLVFSMVWVKSRQGLHPEADRFASISAVIGFIWLALLIALWLRIRIFRMQDALVVLASIVLLVTPWYPFFWADSSYGLTLQFAAMNLLLGLWIGRKISFLKA